jgi:hypothetical protein
MQRTIAIIVLALFLVGFFVLASGCCYNPADIQVKNALKNADARNAIALRETESRYAAQMKILQSQLEGRDVSIFALKEEINKWNNYYTWLSQQTSSDRQKYLDAMTKMVGPTTKPVK